MEMVGYSAICPWKELIALANPCTLTPKPVSEAEVFPVLAATSGKLLLPHHWLTGHSHVLSEEPCGGGGAVPRSIRSSFPAGDVLVKRGNFTALQ